MSKISAGYSGTPLVKKLGIKENSNIIFINSPGNYNRILGKLPEGAVHKKKLAGTLDFIHYFTNDKKELESNFKNFKKHLNSNGSLWISWPKKASKISTNLDENKIRQIGLQHGLVDVKVCAVDEEWSALKFVYRISDRPAK